MLLELAKRMYAYAERTHAVRRPLVVGFLIDSGLTVLLKDAIFRTCPNIPWLSREL